MPITPSQSTSTRKKSIWHTSVSEVLFRNLAKKVPLAELALFCRKLAFLLEAGLIIKDALPILQGQKLGASLDVCLPQVHKSILQGASFTDALKQERIFPAFMVGYIAIGEKTAQLANVCNKLANLYEQNAQVRKQLFAALVYPTAVMLMMFGVAVMAMVMVLPGYARIFDASDISLPAITEVLLRVSAIITGNIFFIIITAVITIAIIFFAATSKNLKPALAKLELKIPILRQGINFHIAQALSLLLTSGIKISDSVQLCADLINNPCVKADLNNISTELAMGDSFSHALGKIQYIDPLLRDLTQVGEETGALPQTMEKCNNYFAANYLHSITRLNKLVEPIITLTMGILLMLIMLAVVLPTFELATVL